MPSPELPFAEQAAYTLNDSQRDEWDPAEKEDLRQEAAILATLAVAEELGRVREAVEDIAEALKDQDRHGAGTHLRNISDWLEKLAGRR